MILGITNESLWNSSPFGGTRKYQGAPMEFLDICTPQISWRFLDFCRRWPYSKNFQGRNGEKVNK